VAKHRAGRPARISRSRPLWKGTLKISLIAIPIRVYPPTNPAGDVRFRQLHARCGTPIHLRKWCPRCNVEVTADELAKGYEVRRGEFVQLDRSDIDAVRPTSTHTIGISRVVALAELDPVHIERPYFVVPDSTDAGHPFAVIRQGLLEKAAIGTVTIHGRENLVALVPRRQGLVMFTLRRTDELRAIDALPELAFAKVTVEKAEARLATRVLESLPASMDLSSYVDEYEAALRQMVADKVRGQEIVAPAREKPAKVVSLMDALRKSLEAAGSTAGPRTDTRRGKVLAHRPGTRAAAKSRPAGRSSERLRRAR
jgi:DNA end-binding protein Ku